MNAINPYAPPAEPKVDAEPPLVAQLVGEVEGLSVEFEQTFEDMITLNEYHLTEGGGKKYLISVGWVMVAVVLVALALLLKKKSWEEILSFTGLALPLGMLIFVGLIAALFLNQKSLRRRNLLKQYASGKNLALVGIRRITITPQFLIFASPLCQSAHRWQGLEKIRCDDQAIYIYSSSFTAYVIPRQAFATAEQRRSFAQLAQSYLDAANA